ncbi:MAG: EAL domain-containing protein [Pseudomonadota bacterium]|nr:EAL domain-containing protein [Pseudomonadota bacterium]
MKERLAQFFSPARDTDGRDRAADNAVLEERYASLKRQVPIIYLVAVANLCGLRLATEGKLGIGLNFPTFLILFAAVRIAQWVLAPARLSHASMRNQLRQTSFFAAILCIVVCAWCLHLIIEADASNRMAVILFGGFTAIGTAYGLSVLPIAARIPIFVLALPLAGTAMISREPQLLGAALSLALVALLILRILIVHNAHFIEVIRSRTLLSREQALTESARQEAILTATTDFLTGLPNRRAFIAALAATTERSTGTFAVAILDLNNFKVINDTLGHLGGDQVLQIVATRLAELIGTNAITARLGGDEFGIILENVSQPGDAHVLGLRIIAEIGKAAVISGREVTADASIGFGFSRRGASAAPSRVLSDADVALYEAKRRKGAHLAIFEPQMEASHQRRSHIERALRDACFKDRVHLVYQPIFDLNSGGIIAIEALSRWDDPTLGQVSPSEFIPIAEQLGVIDEISDHLLRVSLAEAAHWAEFIRLSFNVSAVQLSSSGASKAIARALLEAGLPSQRLQVEVTETALLSDITHAKQNLAELNALGVTIVLDDFGAGYSSIGYLRELTFDQIKLDGVLITAAQDSKNGKRLLAAVIGLCNTLGVAAVAEHIESEEQRNLVHELGCVAGQGYWLKPPLPALELRALLLEEADTLHS